MNRILLEASLWPPILEAGHIGKNRSSKKIEVFYSFSSFLLCEHKRTMNALHYSFLSVTELQI